MMMRVEFRLHLKDLDFLPTSFLSFNQESSTLKPTEDDLKDWKNSSFSSSSSPSPPTPSPYLPIYLSTSLLFPLSPSLFISSCSPSHPRIQFRFLLNSLPLNLNHSLPILSLVNALVIDVGTGTTKVGYAGEDSPKGVFSSYVGHVPISPSSSSSLHDQTSNSSFHPFKDGSPSSSSKRTIVGDSSIHAFKQDMTVQSPFKDGLSKSIRSFLPQNTLLAVGSYAFPQKTKT